MGIITKSIKWSLKLGIAGGSIYLANEAQVFGQVDQAQNGIAKLKTDVKKTIPEYVPKEVLDIVPEMPTIDVKEMIPEMPDVKPDIRGLWNKGVMATFSGLANSPTTIKNYSNDVAVYVKEQMNESK